jgi:hypothetical protein
VTWDGFVRATVRATPSAAVPGRGDPARWRAQARRVVQEAAAVAPALRANDGPNPGAWRDVIGDLLTAAALLMEATGWSFDAVASYQLSRAAAAAGSRTPGSPPA